MAFPNIVTKTGDHGSTGLWSGERVSKTDIRIVTNAEIDFALACLGQCHEGLELSGPFGRQMSEKLLEIQTRFIALMGEVATDEQGHARFLVSREAITEADLEVLDTACDDTRDELNRLGKELRGWRVYGKGGSPAAYLYFARASVRKAEIALWKLKESGHPARGLLPQCLNRLSDLLFMLAVLLEDENV